MDQRFEEIYPDRRIIIKGMRHGFEGHSHIFTHQEEENSSPVVLFLIQPLTLQCECVEGIHPSCQGYGVRRVHGYQLYFT